jgi:iron complex transport system ATP-binding protein
MISAEQIKYSVGTKNILNNISVEFLPGTCNLIIGPNGSGKSTLIKLLSGEINNFDGQLRYNGSDIKNLTKLALAASRAVLSQQTELSFPMTIEEVVMLGRNPHFEFNPTKKDAKIVKEVMALLDLNSFTHRNYQTLSGGEKQRVHYARVLAQIWEVPKGEQRYLFLDEPLNNLDIYYQQIFLSIAVSLLNDTTTLIGVVHDINIALRYADQLFFLKDGALIKNGAPEKIVDAILIKEVFNIDTQLMLHPSTGKPVVLF